MTLIKEDGTGKTDSNTYALVADADAFHEGHLYATAWTGASTANKEKALVLATRLIDASYQFNGAKTKTTQALQWPRRGAVDPDRVPVTVAWVSGMTIESSGYFESSEMPKALVDATCEMARELLIADRTDAPDGEGLAQVSLVGSLSVTFDKKDRMPVISALTQAWLGKLGTLISRGSG
ncbi:MAG: hypothetical protein L0Y58_16660, partial [Verrucomicrobia subdivision 3 bacterium]|nr:hypothetical protein [Limisphaerales bacterium]